ncbi:MAG: rcc01693 family protein [Aestuariivirga sp.]
MNERFPWARMMQLGLGRLRLSPAEFWAATPREIAAAFASTARPPMTRGSLDELMTMFPDAQSSSSC